MPNCPLCRTAHEASAGLRLYNSKNECSICLEICPEMIALPCGHQFCKNDLEKIGFGQVQPRPVPASARTRPPPSRSNRRRPPVLPIIRRERPLAHIMRHIATRVHRPVRPRWVVWSYRTHAAQMSGAQA